MLPYATKTECQTALNRAREKAQRASVARQKPPRDNVEYDVAAAHYQRCIVELEAAINDMAEWDIPEPEETN